MFFCIFCIQFTFTPWLQSNLIMKVKLLRSFTMILFLVWSRKAECDSDFSFMQELKEERETEKDWEITEADLLRIVSETPLQDPLNSFYDPFEPYRIITYAYHKPITNPALHKNPPLPPGFLPQNAPPKSLPTDFFFEDSSFRHIVLEEHAAAFCPFLRRWRDRNPLRTYPIGPNFSEVHPPIKFTPGKGYEVDAELDYLNFRSRQAAHEFTKKITLKAALAAQSSSQQTENTTIYPVNCSKNDSNDPKSSNSAVKVKTVKPEETKKQKKKSKHLEELDVLLSKINEVITSRPECRNLEAFVSIPDYDLRVTSPPSCLEEVIFLLEEHEDRANPVSRESNLPDIVDKLEHYRKVLKDLNEIEALNFGTAKRSGKCPFGFSSISGIKLKSKSKGSNKKRNDQIVKDQISRMKTFTGTVPKFAKLNEGETLFPTDSDSEFENVTKYVFPYKSVPFPSIQDTLKKYVSI